MEVFDHAEYDGDISILIGGLCYQQIKMAQSAILDLTKMCTVAHNVM